MLRPTELPSFPQYEKTKQTWESIKKEIGRFWDKINPADTDATALDRARFDITDELPCGGVFPYKPCIDEDVYETVEAHAPTAPFINTIDGVDAA